MAKTDWAFPEALRPRPEDWRFDLERVLEAMVLVRAEVPAEAFTAGTLGTARLGNGVVMRDDGLVLTVGYLITEATEVWLTNRRGAVVPAHPVAYDQPSGFGLVQALEPLGAPALALGSAAGCRVGDNVIIAGHGGRAHTLRAAVFARREFAGYWEYLLDEAVFTAPAHPQWGGAAMIAPDGRIAGIGSLLVEEQVDGASLQGNMIVPVDLLLPILDALLATGRAGRAPRPWLGLYAAEIQGRLVVASADERGPAAQAGLRRGDVILEAAGENPTGLAELYRAVWALGEAGVEVPVVLGRAGRPIRTVIRSIDRDRLLLRPRLH